MNIVRNLWITVVVTTISTTALDLCAQTAESVLRGPDGHPDLNGTWFNGDGVTHVTVSYTHLTLPTILLE